MVNNYTFNLDNEYLEHSKLGAHYSKNWSKAKQDEYNHWYYQTHKGEIARSRAKYASAVADAREADKNAKYAYKSEGITMKRLTSETNAINAKARAGKLTSKEYAKRKTQFANGVEKQYTAKANASVNAYIKSRQANRKVESESARHKQAISKSKSSAANMIAFDISRNVSKATHAISKTVNKIKNKLIK